MVAAPVDFHSFFAGLVSYEPVALTAQSLSLKSWPPAEPENLSLANPTVHLTSWDLVVNLDAVLSVSTEASFFHSVCLVQVWPTV